MMCYVTKTKRNAWDEFGVVSNREKRRGNQKVWHNCFTPEMALASNSCAQHLPDSCVNLGKALTCSEFQGAMSVPTSVPG